MLLGHFLMLGRPRLIIELGVYQALTTEFICQFMEMNNINGCVAGFDLPDVVERLRQTNEAVQRYEQAGSLRLIPGRLPDSLRDFLRSGQKVDLALIDAIHDYPNVLGELELLWKHIAPDAVIICHDYCEKFDGVRYAVDHFSKRHNAMVLPLISSKKPGPEGMFSTLVALRQRPFRVTVRGTASHRWSKFKFDLFRNPTFHSYWVKYLRPVVKRRGRESAL